MRHRLTASAACFLVVACAPTNLPMDVAEAQCVQYALNGSGGLTVGMSTSTGARDNGWGGGWGGNGVGVGVALETQVPSGRSPAQVYAACVQRRTGLPPVTPFNLRPELRG